MTSGVDVVVAGIVGLRGGLVGEAVPILFRLFFAVPGIWSTRTVAGGLWRRRAVWVTSEVCRRCVCWLLLLAVVWGCCSLLLAELVSLYPGSPLAYVKKIHTALGSTFRSSKYNSKTFCILLSSVLIMY